MAPPGLRCKVWWCRGVETQADVGREDWKDRDRVVVVAWFGGAVVSVPGPVGPALWGGFMPRRKQKRSPKPVTVLPDVTPERRIVCPDCGCHHVPVLYTRPGWGDHPMATRRRRECRNCGRQFTTTELPADER